MTQECPGANPTAVTKAYDIVRWLIGHVGKFPRWHRYALGERIETRMIEDPFVLSRSKHARLGS
ncbi:MAG: hypothetical protein ACREIS_01510 [Nitrospiraceae bacterium]